MTVEEESKRSADGPPADEPEAKAAKVEGDTSMKKEEDIKDEKKDDEVKLPIKDESDKKEKKEKKDKDKEKDKEKKEKKDKSEKKDKDKDKDAEKDRPPAPGVDSKDDPKALAVFDQRSRFKEGQKFLTPPVADATRAFYESLLMEHPESKIAIKFAVEYGLLDREKHNKILKKYLSMKDKGLYDQTKLMMAAKKDSSRKEKTDKEEKKEKKEKKEGKEGKEEKHSKEDKEKKEKKEKGSDKEKDKSEKKEKKEKAESKEKEPEMKAEVKTEEAQVAVAAA